jgi:hypothetical protein
LSSLEDNRQKIKDLKNTRKWFLGLFVLFVLAPLATSTYLFVQFEGPNQLSYGASFLFAVEEITDIKTNSTVVPHSSSSVALIAVLGIFKLIFIGFAAAMVITTVDIHLLKRKRPPIPPGARK